MFCRNFLLGTLLLGGSMLGANDLIYGWDFEDGVLKNIKAWDGATAAITDEYAISGKKSLKIVFRKRTSGVTITPDVEKMSRFEELRFKVHNPKPAPFTKFRILYLNGKEFNGKSVPTWGVVKAQPESTSEIVINIPKTLAALKQKEVNVLQIYKGDPDTVFYLDDFKLYTAEDLKKEAEAARRKLLVEPLQAVQSARNLACGNFLQAVLADYEKSLQLLAARDPQKLSEDDENLITRANDAATLATEIARRNGGNASLLLTGAAPSLRIFRDRPLPETVSFYRMAGAGNESESFQVVAMPARRLENVKVTALPPVSVDGKTVFPPESVQVNPVGYVEVLTSFYYPGSRPGFWPDILTRNHTMTLEKRLQPYWITVKIPANQRAGRYIGEVRFTAAGMDAVSYKYELEVYNFTLPVKGELKTFFDFRYDPNDQKVRRACYDTLFENRLQPISMYINEKVPATPDKYKFVPRLEDLDYCLQKGQNLICLWYLVNGVDKNKNIHNFDENFRQNLAKFIAYVRPIMQKHNAWDMCFVNGFDEIMHREKLAERLKGARDLCTYIKKEIGSDVKISNVGKLMDISPELMDYYFMMTIPAQNFEHIKKAGKTAGFYYVYGDPSPMLDLPGMAARIMPWRVFREGGSCLGYYSTYRYWALKCPYQTAPTGVDWTRNDINIDSYSAKKIAARNGRVGDGNMFYPDRSGAVLASTRIANLRDGIEDFEYLALLKKLDPKHPLLQIPDHITTLNEGVYTQDQRVIDLYRRNVAEAIEKLMKKQGK